MSRRRQRRHNVRKNKGVKVSFIVNLQKAHARLRVLNQRPLMMPLSKK